MSIIFEFFVKNRLILVAIYHCNRKICGDCINERVKRMDFIVEKIKEENKFEIYSF